MKAKLLQEIEWFSSPREKASGIVFNIRQERFYKHLRFVGQTEIEVYDIWTNQDRRTECCFLDIHRRRELAIEDILTCDHTELRNLGRLIVEKPTLLKELYDKREEYTSIYTLLTDFKCVNA